MNRDDLSPIQRAQLVVVEDMIDQNRRMRDALRSLAREECAETGTDCLTVWPDDAAAWCSSCVARVVLA